MSIVEGSNVSCGVRTLHDLWGDPYNHIINLGRDIFVDNEDYSAAFVIWSDVWGRDTNGNSLYRFIKKTFPNSEVLRTKKKVNPNSGNQICVYIWRFPRNFRKWYMKQDAGYVGDGTGYSDSRPWWY